MFGVFEIQAASRSVVIPKGLHSVTMRLCADYTCTDKDPTLDYFRQIIRMLHAATEALLVQYLQQQGIDRNTLERSHHAQTT